MMSGKARFKVILTIGRLAGVGSQMKYLDARVAGDGFDVTLAERPIPTPRSDEVLVRVAASGVNRADLSQIAGRYPAPPGEPETLGLELSGTARRDRGDGLRARGRGRPRGVRRGAGRTASAGPSRAWTSFRPPAFPRRS